MEDLRASKLFQEVLVKTKAGRIQWEPTASETEYFSILPDDFIVTVSSVPDTDSWGQDYQRQALVLRKNDQELLRVTPDVDGVGGQGLTELYEFARRRALRVDAAVDKLLGELAKL